MVQKEIDFPEADGEKAVKLWKEFAQDMQLDIENSGIVVDSQALKGLNGEARIKQLRAIDEKFTALKWDAENLRFTNNVEANALLTKTYRKGWEVPAA